MLVQRLRVSGLLSFGPRGIELPMEPLNVLIGPNGAGKSNVLQVLELLRAAPSGLGEPIRRRGGMSEWLWKGGGSLGAAAVEVIVGGPHGEGSLRHSLTMADNGGRVRVSAEEIADGDVSASDGKAHYRLVRGRHALGIGHCGIAETEAFHGDVRPEESVLSQVRDPRRYPALALLQEQYERIRLYQNWSFGPSAALRRAQRVVIGYRVGTRGSRRGAGRDVEGGGGGRRGCTELHRCR